MVYLDDDALRCDRCDWEEVADGDMYAVAALHLARHRKEDSR